MVAPGVPSCLSHHQEVASPTHVHVGWLVFCFPFRMDVVIASDHNLVHKVCHFGLGNSLTPRNRPYRKRQDMDSRV
eukprot:2177887-Amphidinium_carterae.1